METLAIKHIRKNLDGNPKAKTQQKNTKLNERKKNLDRNTKAKLLKQKISRQISQLKHSKSSKEESNKGNPIDSTTGQVRVYNIELLSWDF